MTKAELRAQLHDFALRLPDTDEAFPWGESALRVRGKAFVFMRLEGDELSFSVNFLTPAVRRSRSRSSSRRITASESTGG